MSAMPFDVAVVIAVRDGADFLAEALESVLAQTLAPFETVVVDDGSTDGSGELAKGMGSEIRVITLEPSGTGAARNRGVAETRAPWIAFLDADDRWMPDKLALQRDAVVDTPDAVAAIGLVRQFFDERLGREDVPEPEIHRGTITSALVIRRDAFDATGGFPTDSRVPEFAAWWLRFQAMKPVVTSVDAVIAERRIHGANAGLTEPDRQAEYVRMVKAMLDKRRNEGS